MVRLGHLTPEQERKANEKLLLNLKMLGEVEFKDVDRYGLNFFAIIMFADLKGYIFRSKFLNLSADPSSLIPLITRAKDHPFDTLFLDPALNFNEVGILSRNASVFPIESKQITHITSVGPTELFTAGFFDGIHLKKTLNSHLVSYFEILHRIGKRRLRLYLMKDFVAVRAGKLAESQYSVAVDVDLQNAVFTNRADFSKVTEKTFNLKELMDEKELSAQAVDLNIKLMRWRQLETLDLNLLHNVKVLLVGAGTLGCQLARNLIGWGIRNISFIDYGKVSHSNPVRQSLYNFEDVVNGGKPKAEAAAEALKRIQPTINAQGHSMRIQMPGHKILEADEAQALAEVDKLDQLVQEHDAVMLLLDTREARWLPTVAAAAHNKICFSVALGFDNFIVIRHGGDPAKHDASKNGIRPGCYFCNDYLSPSNTMRDRTLDQQCTVTRPGLSFISSAYASELLVNMIHTTEEQFAKEKEGSPPSSEFGLVPQHIRGSASGFNVELMSSEAYDK